MLYTCKAPVTQVCTVSLVLTCIAQNCEIDITMHVYRNGSRAGFHSTHCMHHGHLHFYHVQTAFLHA